MIDCKDIEIELYDYCQGNLTSNSMKLVESHLDHCKSCREKVKEEAQMAKLFNNLKDYKPSEKLRANFYSQLYKSEFKKDGVKIFQLYFFRVAASICFITFGFYMGNRDNLNSKEKQITELSIQNKAYKKEMSLAMFESNSASKRIQGINYTDSFDELDNDIIESLVNRVKHDTNTNVKLAALDVLANNIHINIVKEELLKILKKTNSLKVKLEIIWLLKDSKDERLIESMKELLKDETLPQILKPQIKSEISTLI